MEFLSEQQPHLIAKQVKDSQDIPFMLLDIKDNSCVPPRKVFQILHKHEEVEFILVLENKLQIKTTMSEIVLNEGEGAFIPKNVLHVLNTYGNCKCRGFLFPDMLLSSPICDKLYKKVIKHTENPMVDLVFIKKTGNHKEIIEKLMDLNTVASKHFIEPFYKFKLMSTLYDLWYTFAKNIDLDSKNQVKIRKTKGEILKKYLEFIQVNYSNAISVKDIADSGFTSVSECNRIFNMMINITAYEYLIKYRINKSLEFIKVKKYSIAQIADKVGYSSPSQFSKYFKRHVGVTPSAYLKTWEKKK